MTQHGRRTGDGRGGRASGRDVLREVPLQFRCGGYVGALVDKILPDSSSLIAEEEEQLVFYDAAAHHTTELIAFEPVAAGRKKVSGVEIRVPEEFEKVAVKGVGA